MITIESLTVRYGTLTALDNVTMHLIEGTVQGIVGPDGAGKTTLLDALFGSVVPAAGRIVRRGHPLRRNEIAYLTAETPCFPGLTGRDCLDLTLRYRLTLHPEFYFRSAGISLDTPVDEWTAGMRRMLAVALVLMQSKPVVLLDEPFEGIDPVGALTVRQLILFRQGEGATVIVSSRNPASLDFNCDDIRVLEKGRVAFGYCRSSRSGKTKIVL